MFTFLRSKSISTVSAKKNLTHKVQNQERCSMEFDHHGHPIPLWKELYQLIMSKYFELQQLLIGISIL